MKTNTLPMRLRNGAIASTADTITIGSRFDISLARQFGRALARLIERKARHAVIDLSRTRAIDSSGFGALVSGLRKLSQGGTQVILVCSNSSVRRLMDFAGLTRTFVVVERISEARRRLVDATAQDALAS